MSAPPARDRRQRTGGRPDPSFDPEAHRSELLAIIREIEVGEPIAPRDIDAILRRHPRAGRGLFSRSELLAGFRHFARGEAFGQTEASFARCVQMRPVRTQSGVSPVTVLTRPYPCPGHCVFCPSEPGMPKSYLAAEPGAQRAADNRFDPYLQTWNRLAALRAIGHPTDKVELIVLGGTWSSYPEPYQIWFVTRCFEALNDFGGGRDGRADAGEHALNFAGVRPLDGRVGGESYNGAVSRIVSRQLSGAMRAPFEAAPWRQLERAQRDNERAGARGVGLSLETRPDCIDAAEVLRMRRLGCTKVQLGIQTLDDQVLIANRRGHDTNTTRRALGQLRRAGFKLQAHWMANLVGATPGGDVLDFARLFDDPEIRPDELKVYPCSLVASAELMQIHERGEWRPYRHEELLYVVSEALARAPRWCRLTRVIRDISSTDIVDGNRLTNFREVAARELERQGRRSVEIRGREIGRSSLDGAELELRESCYSSGIGEETFLEFVTADDRIAAFARLTFPSGPGEIEEVSESALLRELHVYGAAVEIGSPSGDQAQHRGLGRRLVAAAVGRATAAGFARLSVISAVGTRDYYRQLGFHDGPLYQHLPLG